MSEEKKDTEYKPVLRIGISGNVDSGKSTFLGVLKSGNFDDGKGKTRTEIFNHPHERETGRTSSVSQRSIFVGDRRVHFHDLPGHEKYFRTMIFGLGSSYPNAALVMVEATRGVQKMTKEHLITAVYLRVPIIIVITKIDVAPEKIIKNTIKQIQKRLKNMGKEIYIVKKQEDVQHSLDNISDKFVPLFLISNVKGNDMPEPYTQFKFDYVRDYISQIPVETVTIEAQENPLCVIDKSFRAKGYPFIASIYMKSGQINIGDKLLLGPVNNEYLEVAIRSIHDDDRNNVSYLRKDEMGCVSLKLKDTSIIQTKEDIKTGMIITKKKLEFTKTFMAEVKLFTTHSTTIRIGYNTIIHCGAVKKTVVVKEILKDVKNLSEKEKEDKNDESIQIIGNTYVKPVTCIRGGDSNIFVKFKFLRGMEYLEKGDIFVFREQGTVGSGMIEELLTN